MRYGIVSKASLEVGKEFKGDDMTVNPHRSRWVMPTEQTILSIAQSFLDTSSSTAGTLHHGQPENSGMYRCSQLRLSW